MPDLLLELFSEEIPARMQARAAEDLRKLVTDRLVAASLPYEGAKAFATPRRLAQAKVVSDAKKGDFYVAVIEKPGRAAIDVIAEIVPEVVRAFPWPKSMRWGAQSAKPG